MPDQSQEVTIYCDGAASPNPGKGGYGVVIIRNNQRQELSGGHSKTTNNRMEILGAIIGLRKLSGNKSTVTIYSDSKYVVDMFNGGHADTWRKNHWKRNKGKQDALNPDLWNELLILAAQHEVKFCWVKSHADNKENVRCDELAVLARQGDDLPADEGYEKPMYTEPLKPIKPPEMGQLMLFDAV